ncbi:MAG: hypothetical protein ACQESZ_09845 [Bacteroidota bacterium]
MSRILPQNSEKYTFVILISFEPGHDKNMDNTWMIIMEWKIRMWHVFGSWRVPPKKHGQMNAFIVRMLEPELF